MKKYVIETIEKMINNEIKEAMEFYKKYTSGFYFEFYLYP